MRRLPDSGSIAWRAISVMLSVSPRMIRARSTMRSPVSVIMT